MDGYLLQFCCRDEDKFQHGSKDYKIVMDGGTEEHVQFLIFASTHWYWCNFRLVEISLKMSVDSIVDKLLKYL